MLLTSASHKIRKFRICMPNILASVRNGIHVTDTSYFSPGLGSITTTSFSTISSQVVAIVPNRRRFGHVNFVFSR
jgi:hypothetical protein